MKNEKWIILLDCILLTKEKYKKIFVSTKNDPCQFHILIELNFFVCIYTKLPKSPRPRGIKTVRTSKNACAQKPNSISQKCHKSTP